MRRRALFAASMALAFVGLTGCKDKSEEERIAQRKELAENAKKVKRTGTLNIDFKKQKEEYEKQKKQQQQKP